MTATDGTCEYVLEPDDPETWGGKKARGFCLQEKDLNENNIWTCPHDAVENENLCPFHIGEYDSTTSALKQAISVAKNADDHDTKKRKQQFIGAKFSGFDIGDLKIELAEDFPLDLRHSQFSGGTEFSGSTIDGSLFFQGAIFEEEANFENISINGFANFYATVFEDGADFEKANFENECSFVKSIIKRKQSEGPVAYATTFREAVFKQKADFGGADLLSGAGFVGATFSDRATFSLTDFESAKFNNVEFNDRVDFRNSSFKNYARFENTRFNGSVGFEGASFEDNTHFDQSVFSREVSFVGEQREHSPGGSWGSAKFEGNATFVNANFDDDVLFSAIKKNDDVISVDFNEPPDFTKADIDGAEFMSADLKHADFSNADMTDVILSGADLREAQCEQVRFSRATLFGTDLRGVMLSGAVFGDARIDEDTRFLGHPSGDTDTSPHTLSAIRSRPTCIYDPNYEEDNKYKNIDKAKSVYQVLEELGGRHARPRLQARSFVRRQDLQKDEYKQDAKQADSWEERLIAGARYSRAKVARATLLYGESPWRVIAYSLSIILGFALLFPLGGWMKPEGGDPITYAQIASNPLEILNSVYYSTLTFTALGFGDFKPVGFGRALTTIETGLGAVLLALLVFILGRRAAR